MAKIARIERCALCPERRALLCPGGKKMFVGIVPDEKMCPLEDAEAHDNRIRNEAIAALEEALEDPEICNLAEGFVARIAARLRGE